MSITAVSPVPADRATDDSEALSVEDQLAVAAHCEGEERDRIHAEAVESQLGLARAIAARYRHRGESFDDLLQVASLGLVTAVNRYRPGVGVSFAAFASPTINGELRRHFRDHCWTVRPPRRLQELRPRLRLAELELQQELKRSPSEQELADHLQVAVDEVREAVTAATGYQVLSLDLPRSDYQDSSTLGDQLGDEDTDLGVVEARLTVQPLLSQLSDTEQRVVGLRFFAGLTQQQIADDIGVSQMHVSRMLTKILRQMRESMQDDGTVPAA